MLGRMDGNAGTAICDPRKVLPADDSLAVAGDYFKNDLVFLIGAGEAQSSILHDDIHIR